MYHLHVGVKPKQMKTVQSIAFRLGITPLIDGDGWTVWGERLGVNGNDKKTLHVILPVESQWEARFVAKLLLGETQVTSGTGEYAVLTDAGVWSQFDYEDGGVVFYVPDSNLKDADLRLEVEFDVSERQRANRPQGLRTFDPYNI